MKTFGDAAAWVEATRRRGMDARIKEFLPKADGELLSAARAIIEGKLESEAGTEAGYALNLRLLEAGGATPDDIAMIRPLLEKEAAFKHDLSLHAVNSPVGRAIADAVLPDSEASELLSPVVDDVVAGIEVLNPSFEQGSKKVLAPLFKRASVREALVDAEHRGELSSDQVSDVMVSQMEAEKAEALAANPTSDWSIEACEAWLGVHAPPPEETPATIVGAEDDLPSLAEMQRDIERIDAENEKKNPKSDTEAEYRKYFERA